MNRRKIKKLYLKRVWCHRYYARREKQPWEELYSKFLKDRRISILRYDNVITYRIPAFNSSYGLYVDEWKRHSKAYVIRYNYLKKQLRI